MPTNDHAADEARGLRRTMRDVVALSTLPAVWTSYSPESIARSLAEVLVSTLSLDLLYLRLQGHAGEVPIEVVRSRVRRDVADQVQTIAQALAPCLESDGTDPTPTIPHPLGGGPLRIAITRFGHTGDMGVMVAGSPRPEFPTEADRLLLGLAANQASIAIQQKRVEGSLSEQRERLRVTLASIGDAVITTDTEGRVVSMNPVAELLTGWKNDEAAGHPLPEVFRIVSEQTRQPVEDPALRALRADHIVGLANHTVLIARDGTNRSIDDSAAPIKDRQGRIVGSVLIFRDITERRQLESKLASRLAASRLLASIVESSEDAIVSKSLEGIIQSWNAAAERVFGYTADQAVGRHISLIIPTERAAEEDHIIARIRAGQPVKHFDTVRVRSDGRLIPISLTISPVRDESGRVIGASKIARDITDRVEAEAAAAERNRLTALRADISSALASNGELRDILQECTAALVRHLDAAFARIWMLPESENVLELQASAEPNPHRNGPPSRIKVGELAIGRIASSRQPYLTNDVANDPSASDRDWARQEGISAFAGYPLVVEGRVLGVMALFARTPLADGVRADLPSLANMIALFLDRKRVEEELRRVAAELSEADRRKNEFLAILAHELRNPLAPLRNGLRLLGMAGPREDTLEQARTMMDRQLTQLVRLVDDLMDISRISRGTIILQKQPVELAAVINSAIETSRPLIEQMGHQLTVTLPKQPILLEADLTRLAQVFLNLLNNAAKYSEFGGHIRLTAERHGDAILVSVKDTGIGIAADQLSRIFGMFAQVDRSLEKSQGGLGIGLSLVKRLVEMHGGSIEAKSEGVGKGSEFLVRLPIVVEAAVPPQGEEEAAPPPAALRILIVDDNRDGADSLAMMLRLMGNEVRTAYEGQQGMAVAEEFRPDVILLDIGLPKLNGYEVCRRLRREPWGRRAVLIAVTGWGQEEDRRRSQEAGFDQHMVKPLDPDALMKMLATYQTVNRN